MSFISLLTTRSLVVLPRAVLWCWVGAGLLGWGGTARVQAEEAREIDAAVTPIAPPRVQLPLGERLSFHGRWFGIPVGKGWIEVKERVVLNGRPAYHIQAEVESTELLSTFYPIHDVLHSYLDVDSLQPLQFEKYQREGHYRAEEIVTFDYGRLTASYRSLLNGTTKEVPITPDAQDIVSAFYWLRRQPVIPGQPLALNIYSDEKIYRTEILPLKTLMLELLRRGTFPCLLVEPKASFKGVLVRRGRMRVYVSLDARRVPLFVRVATPWGPMTGVLDRESLNAALLDRPH